MSQYWQSIPMWAYYADAHKGCCIKFNSGTRPFNNALGVSYDECIHAVTLHERNEFHKLKPMLTKSEQWSHEKEWRILANTSDIDGHPLIVDSGRYLLIDSNSIESILVGARMGDSEKKEIIDLVVSHSPQIIVKQVQRHDREYKMDLVTIYQP